MPGADHRDSQRLTRGSERQRLDPFVIAAGDASPRDQRDLMERPFFSLAKAKRVAPILYESGGQRVEVYGMSAPARQQNRRKSRPPGYAGPGPVERVAPLVGLGVSGGKRRRPVICLASAEVISG